MAEMLEYVDYVDTIDLTYKENSNKKFKLTETFIFWTHSKI